MRWCSLLVVGRASVEVADGGEELYVAGGRPVVGSSFVVVHGFEFLFPVSEKFRVQDEFASSDELLVGLFPALGT